MKIEKLAIGGAAMLQLDPHEDSRGFFGRVYCSRELEAAALPFSIVQASLSYTHLAGTIRGLHFQWTPSREGKIVRCIRGAIWDVLLDLRPSSPTYMTHFSIGLDADSRNAVLIPSGVAHGFQTMSDAAEVLYMMSDYFEPDLSAGVRWDDPAFSIRWPRPVSSISAKDAAYGNYERQAFESELERRARGVQ